MRDGPEAGLTQIDAVFGTWRIENITWRIQPLQL
jgi:hypothetical protein